MTSPLQQKLKITGPVVVTANRLGDGAVVYRTSDGRWTTRLEQAAVVDHRAGRDANCWPPRPPTISARSAPMSRRCSLTPDGGVQPGNLREIIRQAGPTIALPAHVRNLSDVSLRRIRSHAGRRARRRIPRPGGAPAVRRADRGRVQAAAADERRLSAAARLHAADRHSLRHAVVGADAHAGACRAPLRPRLRPFHHAAEHPVQLDQARRIARRDGRSRARRPARHADQRQLRAQHHHRSMGRRRARRDRGSAHLGGDPAPAHDAASGILVPAAQVQDRDHRVGARPRRGARFTTSACACIATARARPASR